MQQESSGAASSSEILSSLAQLFASSSTAVEYVRAAAMHPILGAHTVGSELFIVTQDAFVKSIAYFGASAQSERVSLWDDSPLSTAARTGKASWAEVIDPDTGKSHFHFYYPFSSPSHTVGVHVMIKTKNYELALPEAEQLTISMFAGLWLESLGITNQTAVRVTDSSDSNELTERQLVVLEKMSAGLTNARIAEELILSESTIRQETVRIFRKLGVPGRTEAKNMAEQLGLLERSRN